MITQPTPPSRRQPNRSAQVLRSVVTWLVESDRSFRAMQSMVENERRY